MCPGTSELVGQHHHFDLLKAQLPDKIQSTTVTSSMAAEFLAAGTAT